MSLLTLPNELLLIIASTFTPKDLFHLLSTNRRLSHLLTPQLHTLAQAPKSNLPALHWAILRNYLPLVKLLLSNASTPLTEICETGWTPLHYASAEGRPEMVRALLEKGAPTEPKNHINETALEVAAEFAGEDRFRQLLQFPAYRVVDDNFPVSRWHQWTGAERHEAVVRLLVEHGANIDSQDSWGRTALHWGVKVRAVGIVRVLLENGAGMNLQTRDGDTPLIWAVTTMGEERGEEQLEMVRMLLEYGADAALGNMLGYTPLHQATIGGFVEAAEVLLDKGVDVAVVDEMGHTALYNVVVDVAGLGLGIEDNPCIMMLLQHETDAGIERWRGRLSEIFGL